MELDWSKPIEAVREADGRVVPASRLRDGSGWPDQGGQYHVRADFAPMFFNADGSEWKGVSWRIRNVAKPVRTASDMLDRMEALVRRMAADSDMGVATEEARAIVAEMTPPVDPDLVEAREIVALAYEDCDCYWDAAKLRAGECNEEGAVQRALAAIKRGSQCAE